MNQSLVLLFLSALFLLTGCTEKTNASDEGNNKATRSAQTLILNTAEGSWTWLN